MKFTSTAVREQITELLQEAENIHALAEEAERELTDEEQTRFDDILNKVGEDKIDEPTGLYAKAAKLERFERLQAGLQADKPEINPQQSEEPRISRPRFRGRLRAFNNDTQGIDDAYKSGRFLMATLFGHQPSREWCVQNAMETGADELGGYTVPTEFRQTVIDLRESRGFARQWANVTPMSSDHAVVPRRKSGVTAYAVGDNDTITASDKEFNQVELTAKKWAALVRYSSELAEDSFISLADNLASEMAYAFATKEDQSVSIGDGTSTYHGVVGWENFDATNSASSIFTAATGNTAFSTLDLVDFETALGKVPQYAIDEGSAAWFISRAGYYDSIARLINAAGGNANTDLAAGMLPNFLGLPVVFVQVANSTLTAQTATIIAAVGNLRLACTIGDRRSFSVAVDSSRYFDQDQVAIRGTTRTAINLHENGTTSGGDAGPLIAIKTPAS